MREINGTILVWTHSDDSPPQWDVPAYDLDGFSAPRYGRCDSQGYFLDVGENSTDLSHVDWLHGFTDAQMSFRIDESVLEVTLRARWLKQAFIGVFLSYDIGRVHASLDVPALGLQTILQVYTTPVGPFDRTLRWIDVIRIDRVDRWRPPFRHLAYGVCLPFVNRWTGRIIREDTAIWKTRAYVREPKLMASDGAIAAYRRWSSRFYPALRSQPPASR